MGLFEAGLRGQAEAGEAFVFDAPPEGFAEVILQSAESHGRSIPWWYSTPIYTAQLPHLKGNKVLDLRIRTAIA
jgi:hypothetical protein